MSWVAIGVAAAGITASVTLAATAPGAPKAPDAVRSSQKTVYADLRTLAGRRMVEQAAALGQQVEYPTGKFENVYSGKPVWVEPVTVRRGGTGQADHTTPGYWDQRGEIIGRKPVTKVADFRGIGEIDVQAQIARRAAEDGLKLQQEYGTQFIDEARKQAELADPLGTKARKTLFEEINRIREGRDEQTHPVSDALDAQILDDLGLGRGLNGEAKGELERVLAGRAAGGDAATADVQNALETNASAEQRWQGRLQSTLQHLSSGATGEDRRYRENQTDMANLASALAGRTPQSQFANLAGAQQGATPQAPGGGLQNANPNAATVGLTAASSNYATNLNNLANQVNPWFAGLNAAVKGAGAIGAAVTK
jgi:hypothetical protein